MAERGYSLQDLIAAAAAAERLELSERAAQQYIASGLLPLPRAARSSPAPYGEEHLLRLRAIMRLSAQYLSVRDIERCLDRLTLSQMRALLDRTPLQRLPSEGDAQVYINRLMRGLPAGGPPPTLKPDAALLPRPPAARRAAEQSRPASALTVAERSAWIRIAVHPDVELLVRAHPDGSHQARLDRLAAAVQQVLAAEQGG